MIDVNHISKLARIGLAKDEKKKFEKELSSIFDFFTKLEEIKTDRVEPTAQITGLENVTREDKGREKTETETQKLLNLSPQTKNRQVKVKVIL